MSGSFVRFWEGEGVPKDPLNNVVESKHIKGQLGPSVSEVKIQIGIQIEMQGSGFSQTDYNKKLNKSNEKYNVKDFNAKIVIIVINNTNTFWLFYNYATNTVCIWT